MAIKIEDAFNDCFERMMSGESLESCISRYPQYASELDLMLRTSFDVKRRAYPIQPRPEFKYWAGVRMQGVQNYLQKSPLPYKSSSYNLKRNLAITLAAMLVFIIATTTTVAASSDAMPDDPLYGVKLAVEQIQVALTPNEMDKAEIYAKLTEKRAIEIATMADKGKTDKVMATTEIMNYQLQQIEQNLAKYETAASTIPAPARWSTISDNQSGKTSDKAEATIKITETNKQPITQESQRNIASINKAKDSINTRTTKSITILENAMNKVPESIKSNINETIDRAKTTSKHLIRDISNPPDNRSTTDNKTDNGTTNLHEKPKLNTPDINRYDNNDKRSGPNGPDDKDNIKKR
jgi:hypothetical protein